MKVPSWVWVDVCRRSQRFGEGLVLHMQEREMKVDIHAQHYPIPICNVCPGFLCSHSHQFAII